VSGFLLDVGEVLAPREVDLVGRLQRRGLVARAVDGAEVAQRRPGAVAVLHLGLGEAGLDQEGAVFGRQVGVEGHQHVLALEALVAPHLELAAARA
jgi:hypothetical protein